MKYKTLFVSTFSLGKFIKLLFNPIKFKTHYQQFLHPIVSKLRSKIFPRFNHTPNTQSLRRNLTFPNKFFTVSIVSVLQKFSLSLQPIRSENQFTSIILSLCNFHIVRWTFLLLLGTGMERGGFEFRKEEYIYICIVSRSIEIRAQKSPYIYIYFLQVCFIGPWIMSVQRGTMLNPINF